MRRPRLERHTLPQARTGRRQVQPGVRRLVGRAIADRIALARRGPGPGLATDTARRRVPREGPAGLSPTAVTGGTESPLVPTVERARSVEAVRTTDPQPPTATRASHHRVCTEPHDRACPIALKDWSLGCPSNDPKSAARRHASRGASAAVAGGESSTNPGLKVR